MYLVQSSNSLILLSHLANSKDFRANLRNSSEQPTGVAVLVVTDKALSLLA